VEIHRRSRLVPRPPAESVSPIPVAGSKRLIKAHSYNNSLSTIALLRD